MVAYEKGSKDVLGLGPPDPAFIARGEQNFSRFAAVLNDSLKGKTWVLGNRLTLADFSIGGFPPQSGWSCRWDASRISAGGTRA
jgi:glutathione S-transferase